MGRHSSSPAPRQTALPGSQHGPAAPQAQPRAGTAPAHSSLCPRGGKLRHQVMVRAGTHADTLTRGCKPLWMAVSVAQSRRRRWKKGWEEARGRPLAAKGAGAADTAFGAGQRGRTDGSSGAAACACFRHLARPQAPKAGLRSGHLLPGLGKGGKKTTAVENSKCAHQSTKET